MRDNFRLAAGCAGVRKRARAVSSHAACTMYNTIAGNLFGNEGECSCLKDCGCIRDPDHSIKYAD